MRFLRCKVNNRRNDKRGQYDRVKNLVLAPGYYIKIFLRVFSSRRYSKYFHCFHGEREEVDTALLVKSYDDKNYAILFTMKNDIIKKLEDIVSNLGFPEWNVSVEIPSDITHGDYSTNVAFSLANSLKISPLQIAENIVRDLQVSDLANKFASITPVKPGFINFFISDKALIDCIIQTVKYPSLSGKGNEYNGKRIMVEYAHPNTHKEMHIGHLRTLITGEAIARILEAENATVFRANYQGDIGPHVAKALYGIQKIMSEKSINLSDVKLWSNFDKAHLLGEGYVRGNKDYETGKEDIDRINSSLYKGEKGYIRDLYEITHKWSMDYYNDFYKRFHTKFDHLFLESDMVECSVRIIREQIGKIFEESDGAVIFPGEKYGLHTRVFITQVGNPTYEGKEICNGFKEYEVFHFDKKIHVVASEQIGYFQVVFKALELLDPKKFSHKQYHLPMGMVQLTDRKMSSRTGIILTVDWLIDQVKMETVKLLKEGELSTEEKNRVVEDVTIGAIKYSILKVDTKQNVVFDIKTSVTLEGNSGPYLQYSYVRTQSILKKAAFSYTKDLRDFQDYHLNDLEKELLRLLHQFSDAVSKAAAELSPSTICTYLYSLAKSFNIFYQEHRVINAIGYKEQNFRLLLTEAVGITLGRGLSLLGIAAPKKM